MAYSRETFSTISSFVKTRGNRFTWNEVGIHYATLNSLVKRGYLYKDESGYYTVTTKGKMFANIEFLTAGREYFCLRKKGAKLGMMCSIKGPDILDAWDNVWDWDEEGLYLSYHEPNAVERFIGKKENNNA